MCARCIQHAWRHIVRSAHFLATAHILVPDGKYAARIKQEIVSGKISFEEAAKAYSTCPSASKGGSLGTFGPGQMVPSFNDVSFEPLRPRLLRVSRMSCLGFCTTVYCVTLDFLLAHPQYCFDPDTPLNEISDPVRTNFGAHLIKLTKKP